MYAHSLEFAIGNFGGVILGPFLTNCHPYACYFWLCNSLVSTGCSHSGYIALGCVFHDRHHEFFSCNFGVGGMWDGMTGTAYEGNGAVEYGEEGRRVVASGGGGGERRTGGGVERKKEE